MKVTIDIDCTPEEARAFLGLPDLRPLHAAYLERMMSLVKDGLGPADVEKMMRAWMPGAEQWQSAFWNLATGGKSGS
ncbi:MAG: hypothetical protein INF91_02530 [Alphaproteobacteria bacterium]|nr:hypothetical protein [Alphaproteobacteria bacterium]